MRRPTCVVTGSACGIGAATVAALAASGNDTFGFDLQQQAAQDVALQAEREHPPTRHAAIGVDVADEAGVITVSPGVTDTPMIERPLSDPTQRRRLEDLAAQRRIGAAAEIASGIVYLLSPGASFTHGANLVIDGGLVLQ